MNLIKPKECTDCHKEKTVRPVYIFSESMDRKKQVIQPGG
jgi:hypothetical protein